MSARRQQVLLREMSASCRGAPAHRVPIGPRHPHRSHQTLHRLLVSTRLTSRTFCEIGELCAVIMHILPSAGHLRPLVKAYVLVNCCRTTNSTLHVRLSAVNFFSTGHWVDISRRRWTVSAFRCSCHVSRNSVANPALPLNTGKLLDNIGR